MASLSQIPSWLDLPNFVQAMREGAATGLAARKQDTDESQAADRLQLAYDTLAEKERVANELANYKADQQSAALALKAQDSESLSNYRDAMAQHWQDQADKPTYHFGADGGIYEITPDRQVKTLKEPKVKDPASGETTTDTYKIPAVEAVEGKPEQPAYGGWPLTGWFAHGAVPAVPAQPAQPERTIRKTVKGSAADALQEQDLNELDSPAPQEGTTKRIKVKNSAGKVGTIPADQLDDALAKGYTVVK